MLEALNEKTACQVAKVQGGHWTAIRKPVMAILAELLPILGREYQIMQASRANLRAVFRANADKSKNARRILYPPKKQKPIELLDKIDQNKSTKTIDYKTPNHAPPFTSNVSQQSPQELAKIGKQIQDLSDIARLKDE